MTAFFVQLRATRQNPRSLNIASEMPATLASLPAEIHARIAGMCALQDRRFTDAKLAIGTLRFPLAGPAMDSQFTILGALSLVSKHWAKVTAPYRFSVRRSLQHSGLSPSRFHRLMSILGTEADGVAGRVAPIPDGLQSQVRLSLIHI